MGQLGQNLETGPGGVQVQEEGGVQWRKSERKRGSNGGGAVRLTGRGIPAGREAVAKLG